MTTKQNSTPRKSKQGKPVNIFVKFSDREGMKTLTGLVVACSDLERGALRGKKAAELYAIRCKRHATQLRQGRRWCESNGYMTNGQLAGPAYRKAAAYIEKHKRFTVENVQAKAGAKMTALTTTQICNLVDVAQGSGAVALLEDLAEELYSQLKDAIEKETWDKLGLAEDAVLSTFPQEQFMAYEAAYGYYFAMHGRAMLICGMLLANRAQALALLGVAGEQ